MKKNQIQRTIKLNQPQWDAFQVMTPGNTVALNWGRGVGKSWGVDGRVCSYIAEFDGVVRNWAMGQVRGLRVQYVMPTLKQFKHVHWATLESLLGTGGQFAELGGKPDRAAGTWKFPGGSMIIPFGVDTPNNAKLARGFRTDISVLDEYDDVDADVADGIIQPALSAGWSLRMLWLSGTPTRGRYGLWYRSFKNGHLGKSIRRGDDVGIEDPEQLEALSKFYTFHATYKDAPETVDRAAVAMARRDATPATFKREWEADPDAGEGLVYSMMDRDFHVRRPPSDLKFSEYFICGDKGWEDPGVLLLCAQEGHGNDATVWVLKEIFEQHRTPDWWVDKMKGLMKEFPRAKLYHDPSAPDLVMSYRKVGAKPQDVDNSILEGVAAVANMMAIRRYEVGGKEIKKSRIYFHPSCTNTIREHGMYRRKKRKDGTFGEDPIDRDNHSCDSLRYGIFNRFKHLPPSGMYTGTQDLGIF